MILFNIKQNDVNLRLDNFLRKTFSKISLTDIYKIIRTKKVKVNDKKCETSYRLKLNDNIKVFLDKKYLSKTNDKHTFLLSKNKLDIVYQDENIMLVNKPVGLLTHGDDSNNHDTLINRIKKYLIENKQ
jgi:23S rRNA pseudouridine955/2504/2580 synthase